jgi:hypothetical protein
MDRERRGGSPRREVVEGRVDSTRRPNACPRCGFVYTDLNRPRGPRMSIYESCLRTPTWRCPCGAWLRTKPLTFGWIDIAATLILATIQFFVAVRFWWARVSLIYFLPIGVWFAFRTSNQDAIEEVPAPEDAHEKVA